MNVFLTSGCNIPVRTNKNSPGVLMPVVGMCLIGEALLLCRYHDTSIVNSQPMFYVVKSVVENGYQFYQSIHSFTLADSDSQPYAMYPRFK